MEIRKITDNRDSYKELLLIADPDWSNIQKYLYEGTLLAAYVENECVGVSHYMTNESLETEIYNIGLLETCRGKGYGKLLLQATIEDIRQYNNGSIVLGTGNSSIENIAFYQRCGFEITDIWFNYFLEAYKDPIFENKIQCKHMLRFKYGLE